VGRAFAESLGYPQELLVGEKVASNSR
jgi:hypothetical protein